MSASFAERLVAAGLSPSEAAAKETRFARLAGAELADPAAWFVPGRVELLGKHTDYAGGRSLLCTVERGFCFLAEPRDDAQLHLEDAGSGSRVLLSLEGRVPEVTGRGAWATYPAAVARRLRRDFGITRGARIVFASDLPPAAGLSSSTALCIGVFLALARANALERAPAYRAAIPDPLHLAGYLGALEAGKAFGPFPGDAGVGTLSGSQDQTAILCAAPGELVQFSFDPVRFERRLPFPPGHLLVIGATGVIAEKTGAAQESYNAAARAVAEILRRWQEATGRSDATLAAALASSPSARGRLTALAAGDPVLAARLEQFVTESTELVPAAGDALLLDDLAGFGAVVDRSHRGADRGLRNQIPETNHLQRSARRLGALGASAFGAGFGGSVWALIPEARAEAFQREWMADYLGAFPVHQGRAEFFATRAGPPLLQLR